MQPGRLLAITSVIVPLTLPTVIHAQGGSGVQLFSAYDNSFPGGAGVAGVGLTLGAGPIAARGTFGLTLSTFTTTTGPLPMPNAGRWTGDADLILADNVLGLGSLFGGFVHPYGFVGVGAHSARSSPTLGSAVKTWSYGGGVTLPISSSVSLEGEMRTREPLGSTIVAASDFVRGNEFRVGLALSFGGGRTRGWDRGSSSSSRSAPTRTGSRTTWPAGSTNASGAARRVVPDAERYLGVPYVYGGSTPQGFDCSGFVQYVYAREGVDLPRTSRQMGGSGMAINRSAGAMAVGDLLLFSQGGAISHVAIYAGDGRIIHSSSSGHGVRYDDLNTPRGRWYVDHLVAVRRVATGAGSVAAAFARSLIPFDHFDPPDSAPPPRGR